MNLIVFISFFAIFFALNFLIKHSKLGKRLTSSKKIFLLSIVSITLVQLLSVLLYKEQALDVFLFKDAGHYLRQRIDFYWIDSDHNKYPFFPFLIFLFAGFDWILEIIPQLNFMILIKLTLLFPLHFLAFWIMKQSKGLIIGRKSYLGLITSPIVYAVIFFHGQIDIILMAFFVISVWAWNLRSGARSWLTSTLLYTGSVASKTWSILFAPFLLWYNKKDWKIYLSIATTGILLILNIFGYTRYVDGSSVRTVLPAILKPGGPIGEWGITLLKPLLPIIIDYKLLIYGAFLFFGYLLILRTKYTFWKSITLFILWLYIVAIHWAVQYLIWILPFALFNRKWLGEKWLSAFANVSAIYVFFCYINIIQESVVIPLYLIRFVGLIIWLSVAFKFLNKIRLNDE